MGCAQSAPGCAVLGAQPHAVLLTGQVWARGGRRRVRPCMKLLGARCRTSPGPAAGLGRVQRAGAGAHSDETVCAVQTLGPGINM
jgi:hypothetical protein